MDILLITIPVWMYIIKLNDISNIGKFTLFIVLNSIINMTIKNIVKQPRPTKNPPKFDTYGMPSGHAQAVWFIVFYKINESHPDVTKILISMAIISSIQRIYSKKHTLSQVLWGFMIGSTLGLLASKL
tara:strand:+ start:49 stop:432 length:384 start_codon:yes stop_codon:yes gene_type:complete